jgi:hypothetical protein
MSSSFKACKCGNQETIHVHQIGKFFLKCHFCGHQSKPHETQDGAIALWNGVDYTNSDLENAIITVRLLRGSERMQSDEFLHALDMILNAVTKT